MTPELLSKLQDKTARVGVLMGGMSSERAVSKKSGKAVASALRARGFQVVEIDVGPDLPLQLRVGEVDVAWLALHGVFGEDGCVQGLLEIMRIPYTGSGVRGSAMAMDKVATKRMLRDTVVRLPGDRTWRAGDPLPEDLEFPVVAKTPSGGSTIGVFICASAAELESALVQCAEMDELVLLEDMIEGREITVAVLAGRPLPVVEIRPRDGFFDFEAKYTEGTTDYLVPAPVDATVVADAQAQAAAAFAKLGLSGIARADFIVDSQNRSWFLEINTIPGMTATSLSPMAADAAGIDFETLVEALLMEARTHVERGDAHAATPGQKASVS